MDYTVDKLLAIAAAEIGYHEKASNANLDDKTANSGSANYTKYARDLAAAGYYQSNKQGYAWCDMFVDWCFLQLCGGDPDKAQEIICQTGVYGAGCEWSAKYYKQQNRFFSAPEVGDQVFFNSYAHTGIVEKIEGGTVHTIEGNTGNQVARRAYVLGAAVIDGYGRPKYDAPATDAAADSTADSTPTATASAAIKAGDIVSLAADATYYSGKSIPAWVKATAWIVQSVSGSRAVIDASQDGRYHICSPVDVAYLSLVQSGEEKTVEALAQEVIAGKWGNGADRKAALEAAGYDYRAVQDAVNALLA